MDWQNIVLAGNEAWRLAAFFAVVVLGLAGAKAGAFALRRSAAVLEQHHRMVPASALKALAKSAGMIALAIAFPVGTAFLTMGEGLAGILHTVRGVLIGLAIGFTLYQLVDVVFVAMTTYTSRTRSKMDDMLVPIVRTSLRVTVIALTVLQVAQTLTDRPLTSILAGLGVGGLAVALAAQDTIKHFFGSLVLFADHPFQVGERIVVDEVDGTIEEVGFRSTRIRTLTGHLVTMPNGDLANKTIANISKRPYIRHHVVLGITYDTPYEKVVRARDIVREILVDHEGRHPDFPPRVYFEQFAGTSLNLFVMFWYHPADFWSYMAFVDRFNLDVLSRFTAEGIDFAFPTQTLYLAGDPKRPLYPPPAATTEKV
jgi:MscS family membrane protein